MRIVAGTNKGRHFNPPKGFNSRPTTDFAKESLFNILENRFDLQSLNVLDLFAGTGSISYEFCSRGAISVVSVEKNHRYVEAIKKNIEDFKFQQANVVCADAVKYIARCNKSSFDLIFADPPFNYQDYQALYDVIVKIFLIKQDVCLIIEHAPEADFSNWKFYSETRKYGGVCFTIFDS